MRRVKPPIHALPWHGAASLVLTAAGVGLAAWAQYLTTRSTPRLLSRADFLSPLFRVYANPDAVSVFVVLFLLAAAAVGAASLINARQDTARAAFDGLDDLGNLRAFRAYALGPIVWMLVPIGVGLWGVFLLQLHQDQYTHWLNLVLLMALMLVAAPLVVRDAQAGAFSFRWPRNVWPHAADLVIACGIALAFIWLNAHDLRSWKYAAIGDEYNNFYFSLGIAQGTVDFNPWSHVGADNLASMLGNAAQGLFLKIGTGDNFAWRFYSVVLIGATLIPYYFLLRELFNRRMAIVATALFATSHYIFGYVHHVGYADCIPPTVLGLLALVLGTRLNSISLLFLAGAFLGIGFYTFETGRAGVIVVSLLMLTFGIKSFRPPIFLPLASGFIMLALPLFATDGFRHVLDQMSSQSAANYSSTIVGPRWERLQDNVQLTFVSFNYSMAGRHYVWGSLADPVTAALLPLGLGIAAANFLRPAYRLLLVWWLVALAAGGFTNPYPMVPVSRLQYAVPAVAALAAIAVDHIIDTLTRSRVHEGSRTQWRFRSARTACVAMVAIAGVVAPATYLNLHRFWVETPQRFGTSSLEAVSMRAYGEGDCEGRRTVLIARDPLALADKVFRSYKIEPSPSYLIWQHLMPVLDRDGSMPLGQPDCVIVQTDALQAEDLARVLKSIPATVPALDEARVISDERGERIVYLFSRDRSAR